MADHVLTLNLTDETLERLKAAARAAGMTPHDYAVAILERVLAGEAGKGVSRELGVREGDTPFVADGGAAPWPPTKPYDTAEAERRLAEYDRTGEFIEFEEWAEGFERELEDMLKTRP
ncbi:hypothetical protein [Brevundimonas sp.]|jgi:hypothetical protein|uniref:hypothetical protein n=1 Tax=Brevundimonas sp. TaxID=1871086 RepID=UPI0037BF9F27